MLKKFKNSLIAAFLISFCFSIVTYSDEHYEVTPKTIKTTETKSETISAWAKNDVDEAIELGIAPPDLKEKCKDNITREEFFDLVYNLISDYSKEEIPETSQSAPLGDTHNEKIIKLWWWGIVKGKGTFTQEPVISPDGFVKRYPTLTIVKPDDFLSREEAATIIIRVIEKFFPMPATEMWFEYSDVNEISDWALNSVQVISNMGFMKGVGNNKFAPKSTYTVEQAVVTVMRVCECAEKVNLQSIS